MVDIRRHVKSVRHASELQIIVFCILFIISWVFVALNRGNADYFAYQEIYNSIMESGELVDDIEVGFVYLIHASVYFGFSFEIFFTIITTIALVLFANSVFSYCKKPAVVYLLYMIVNMFYDTVQCRNFLAFAICLFAIRYLGRKNIVYIALCIVAASISSLMILFCFVFFINKQGLKKSKFIIVFCVSTIIFIITNSFFVNIAGRYIPAVYRYVSPITQTYKAAIIFIAMYMSIYLSVYFKSSNLDKDDGQEGRNLTNVINRFAQLTLITMPLLFLNLAYERIFRNGLIFLFISSINMTYYNKTYFYAFRRFINLALLITITLICFISFYCIGNNYTSIFIPMFKQNAFFSIFKG